MYYTVVVFLLMLQRNHHEKASQISTRTSLSINLRLFWGNPKPPRLRIVRIPRTGRHLPAIRPQQHHRALHGNALRRILDRLPHHSLRQKIPLEQLFS